MLPQTPRTTADTFQVMFDTSSFENILKHRFSTTTQFGLTVIFLVEFPDNFNLLIPTIVYS